MSALNDIGRDLVVFLAASNPIPDPDPHPDPHPSPNPNSDPNPNPDPDPNPYPNPSPSPSPNPDLPSQVFLAASVLVTPAAQLLGITPVLGFLLMGAPTRTLTLTLALTT